MVSHFEKMLYDQAQLAWAYLDGCQIARWERIRFLLPIRVGVA